MFFTNEISEHANEAICIIMMKFLQRKNKIRIFRKKSKYLPIKLNYFMTLIFGRNEPIDVQQIITLNSNVSLKICF